MAFVLQPGEPVVQGVLRVLLGQLDNAVGHLSRQEADPKDAVHETRKAIKRVRTTLRLLRGAMGKANFARENAGFAELGRKLAPARDAQTLVEAVERLGRYAVGSPYAEAVAPVQQAFAALCPAQPLDEELLHEIVAAFQSARQRIEAWALDLSPAALRPSLRRGVQRMVARGRRAYELAYAEPSDDHFHNWRKRIKDLYYTASLLHLTQPEKLSELVDALDKLADDLGDEHDLGVLATRLHAAPQTTGGPVPVALLLQLIARRREELRRELRPAGNKLYRRGPKKMARFLTRGLAV